MLTTVRRNARGACGRQTFLPVPVPEAGTTLSIGFYGTREVLLDQAYVALTESVYGALVVQTRLKPYDTLYSNNGDDVLDGAAGNDKSRCWRDGASGAFRTAESDAMFEMRSVG